MSHHVKPQPELAKRYGVGARTLPEELIYKLLASDSIFQRQRATLDTPDALEYVILNLLDMQSVAEYYGYKSVQPFYSWLQRYDLIRFLYDTLGSVIDTITDAMTDIEERKAFAGETSFSGLPIDMVFYIPPSLEGMTIKDIRAIRTRLIYQRHQNIGRYRLKIPAGAPLPDESTA